MATITMLEHPPAPTSAVKRPRNHSISPKKKVSFNASISASPTAPNVFQTWSTPEKTRQPAKTPRSLRSIHRPPQPSSANPSSFPSRSDRRRSSVLKEIQSLQPLTPSGSKPVWTSNSPKLLSENLEALIRAAATPESRFPPGDATPNSVHTKTPQKRMRREDEYTESNDEYYEMKEKENREPSPRKRRITRSSTTTASGGGAASKTVGETISIPKLPMNKVVQVQPKIDLAKLAPQPLRISYKSHPLSDRSDSWYINQFRKLFRQTSQFCTQYFSIHNLDTGAFFEPWVAAGSSDEFVTWAEQVARPDMTSGGWDRLMRESRQRKWVVMGVLMKVLRVKVFDAELFGGSKEQVELLHGLSRALIGQEGFGRQALRAETVRTIIGQSAVTENFYSSVATLTAQISLLLKPLSDYLYGMQPRLESSLPKIEDQYQSLHNLVSTAAYLSICIKLSPTIFTFNDVMPGTYWDDKEHYSLENELYAESRDAVLVAHEERYAAWEDHRAKLIVQIDDLEAIRKGESRAAGKAREKLEAHNVKEPGDPARDYRAMCKIGVWPVITRYKPGGDEDDEKEDCSKTLSKKDGFRILQLAKGAVVIYYGWDRKGDDGRLERNPAGESVRLRAWVRGKAEEKGLGETSKVVAALGAAVAGVMMVGGYGLLADSIPALQGMEFIEAAKFVASSVLSVWHY